MVACVGFAAWAWLRPYDAGVDPGARCRVLGVRLERDMSFYWLDVGLEVTAEGGHRLGSPVRLVTAAGRELEPAGTRFERQAGGEVTGLGFKFWLETADLDGPLKLRIHDGMLVIRSGSGVPRLGASGVGSFSTSRW